MEGGVQNPLRLDGPKGPCDTDDQEHRLLSPKPTIQRLLSPNERHGIALDLLPVVVKGEQQRCVLALLLDRAPVERMVESTIYDLLDIVAIDDSLVSIWSWSKEIDVADLNLSGSAMLDRAHLRGGASCSRAVRSIHRLQCAQCEWHALRACCWGG